MNRLINLKKMNFTVLLGLALIILGLSIWIFSVIEIKSNELILTTQNVRIEEVWQAEGALQWWNNFYAATIIPATAILTLAGIATILSPRLLNSPKQKHTLKKFEKELQKVCKI